MNNSLIAYKVYGNISESDWDDFFSEGNPSVTISQLGSPEASHDSIPHGKDFVIEKSAEDGFFDATVREFTPEAILQVLAHVNECRVSEIVLRRAVPVAA